MTSLLQPARTVLPPEDPEPLGDLRLFLERVTAPTVLRGPDGEEVALPAVVCDVLKAVAGALATGRAITVAPMDQVLTTQQAADFLGISRPTLVKMLEEGRIPYERPAGGRHRRVKLRDVLAYQSQRRDARQATLDELTREAAELDALTPPEGYLDELRAVRKGERG